MYRVLVAAAVLAITNPAFAAEHVVRMSGANYEPSQIDGRVGDTIRFVNDDTVNHDVFVPTGGFGIDLGRQEPGDERSMRLGKAGTFEAECVFHGHMLLTVSVRR
ncbi:MAG: hypothetical protein HKM95_13300 [Inquilinus sp.]|nr:hypothetical protein [Inquilinus sp.]